VTFEVEPGREQQLGIGIDTGSQRTGDEAERDDSSTRTEAALTWNAIDELEAVPRRRSEPRERLDAEMRFVGRAVTVGHFQLVPQIERHGRAVEARTEIGGRRRRSDADRHRAASAIASGSGSTCSGGGVRRVTLSGSFRP